MLGIQKIGSAGKNKFWKKKHPHFIFDRSQSVIGILHFRRHMTDPLTPPLRTDSIMWAGVSTGGWEQTEEPHLGHSHSSASAHWSTESPG